MILAIFFKKTEDFNESNFKTKRTLFGKTGDLIKVNDGYGRNLLIPKGLAIDANEKNIKTFEHEKRNILAKGGKRAQNRRGSGYHSLMSTITITRKVGDQDKIFGSVTTKDIESALKEKGYDINRKMIFIIMMNI